MKKLLVVLLLVCAAGWAFADTAQITVVSAPTGAAGPYKFNVVQSNPAYPSGNQFLVCWSDKNVIHIGEMWTADVFTIADVPVAGPFNQTTLSYTEIAWLAMELIKHPGDVDLQVAVWQVAGLYPANGTFHDTVNQADVDTDIANALAAIAGGYDASNALFYLPVNSDGRFITDGPQPLVGFVPEPGSLLLLGSGILSVAGAIRRRIIG